ncbi:MULTISPECIES: ROK family transcriptional regulator [unclassified Rathayibacter]|uniref:ROK family transcriptional regulator n=1 Tax=unclassified Rathayibacter TaxID=2609250 RepID=UPI000CE8428A|nr:MULTISPECIES: ROK family transcriptional regulator [unclassified Rathayibacter]PPF41065.1 sugar kinase [Rathayibacter sp. AY1A3]PPI41691.1 sugar kinase [Rathayibacter sp. RFBD1]PPI63192.1 sugar kinase [Rathayibacter sp. TRS19]
MAAERFTGLAAVLATIRSEPSLTQGELTDRVGLGRSVVAERVSELEEAQLLVTGGLAPSTGGRAPRRLQINPHAGFVIGIDVTAYDLFVAAADLTGGILSSLHETIDVADGPEPILARVKVLTNRLLAQRTWPGELLAIAAGMAGPVAFDTGRTVGVPMLPGWEDHPVRAELEEEWDVPVWVDSRVNLLALAEARSNPAARTARNAIYFEFGVGCAASLIVDGQLYRGAHGLAGAIGHTAVAEASHVVCRCGRVGCLEAITSGWAIARDGRLLAESGRSPLLAAALAANGEVRPIDVTAAAEGGDAAAIALLERAAALLGSSMATVVAFFAPQLLIIGGGIARAGELALVPLRQALDSRILPAAAADLLVELPVLDENSGGVDGAVHLALEELFTRDQLPRLLSTVATRAALSA